MKKPTVIFIIGMLVGATLLAKRTIPIFRIE